jgi:outer membrane protein TolC
LLTGHKIPQLAVFSMIMSELLELDAMKKCMKTVSHSLLVNSPAIGIFSAGLVGFASPLYAQTLSLEQIYSQAEKTTTPPPPSIELPINSTVLPTIAKPTIAKPTIAKPTISAAPPSLVPAIEKPVSAKLSEGDRIAPAPEALYTPANPLLFPTDKSEVEIKGIRPLTLKQTLELAERNSRDLEVSRLQLEQQKAFMREVQASAFPTVDLVSTLTRSRSAGEGITRRGAVAELIAALNGDEAEARRTSPNSFTSTLAPESTTWDTAIQVNYDLYTSGSRAARHRIAEGRLRAAELAMERVREQLRLDATGDYYDLQEADEQVRINKKAVENSVQSLRDTQLQEQVGLGTRFDVLRSEVQLANNQQQLTNAQAAQIVRRRQISQRLSLPEHITVIADDDVRKQGAWKYSLDETIVLAYKQRVELEEQLVQRDISEATRKQALSALGPTIKLQASYNLLKIFEQPVREPVGGYSLSAVAQWRVFDGGAARAQAEQQTIEGKLAETRFTQSRNSIRFQVEQAYATLLSNDKNIETTSSALNQAKESLRLAKLRFQAGVGTQSDVINAETDLTRAEGNRLTAILGYNRSIAQLRRSVSNIAPE